MAYFDKVGLLLWNEDRSRFMVCEKNHGTNNYIMPGGRREPGEDDVNCLTREINEEPDTDLATDTLTYIGEYLDTAASDPTKDVSIRLYEGKVHGTPKPSNEIVAFFWIGKEDTNNIRVSSIIRTKILPDLIARNILI